MTEAPLYQTTLSAKARRGLLLNAVGSVLLTLLSGWQWWTGGHWLHLMILCIMAPVALLVIVTYLRSRHPLEVFSDRIVLNSVISTTYPVTHIEGIGTHPKRGEPSLTFQDPTTGVRGEAAIHWRFIREPQPEVLTQIERALAAAS